LDCLWDSIGFYLKVLFMELLPWNNIAMTIMDIFVVLHREHTLSVKKNNMQVVYLHMRLTLNSVLKGFLNGRVLWLIGSSLGWIELRSHQIRQKYFILLMHLFCLICVLKSICWSSSSWAPCLYGMIDIHHCYRLTFCLHLQNSCPHSGCSTWFETLVSIYKTAFPHNAKLLLSYCLQLSWIMKWGLKTPYFLKIHNI
jgi:hypothetical protein